MTDTNAPRRLRTGNLHRSTRNRHRNAWHLPFATLLQEVAPRGFEVQVEVWLSLEPPRADVVLMRRGKKGDIRGSKAFWRLWPLLSPVTILEYKSPVRSSFRRGDLVRLVSYGALYHSRHLKNLVNCDELTLVLVVASLTPTLLDEIERMGWKLEPLERGYARISGVMYPCYLVVIDDVCQEEQNELLRAFSHHPVQDPLVRSWISFWMKEPKMRRIRRPTREEVNQIMRDLVKRLPTEERVEGLDPKVLIERIPSDKLVVNLPLDVLRGLSAEYLQTLPEGVQLKVQKRLNKKAPRARTSTKESSTQTVGAPTTRRSRKAA